MVDYYSLGGIDDSIIKAERKKAKQLRSTRWWQQNIH